MVLNDLKGVNAENATAGGTVIRENGTLKGMPYIHHVGTELGDDLRKS